LTRSYGVCRLRWQPPSGCSGHDSKLACSQNRCEMYSSADSANASCSCTPPRPGWPDTVRASPLFPTSSRLACHASSAGQRRQPVFGRRQARHARRAHTSAGLWTCGDRPTSLWTAVWTAAAWKALARIECRPHARPQLRKPGLSPQGPQPRRRRTCFGIPTYRRPLPARPTRRPATTSAETPRRAVPPARSADLNRNPGSHRRWIAKERGN
jgi:hypothetical protein